MTAEESLARIKAALEAVVGSSKEDDDSDEEEDAEDDEAPDSDDFNPCDVFGGNLDDAYSGGIHRGQQEFAKELLKLF